MAISIPPPADRWLVASASSGGGWLKSIQFSRAQARSERTKAGSRVDAALTNQASGL